MGLTALKTSVLPEGTCGKQFPCTGILLKETIYTKNGILPIVERLQRVWQWYAFIIKSIYYTNLDPFLYTFSSCLLNITLAHYHFPT